MQKDILQVCYSMTNALNIACYSHVKQIFSLTLGKGLALLATVLVFWGGVSKQEKAETRHSERHTVALACFVYKYKAELRHVSAQEGKPDLKISCCMHVKAELPQTGKEQILAKTQ